ncbi:MAG: hypothetical protein M0Q16_10405 [Candidatus Cloacimonetes bacterium]|nr:hypothetical protein [Candidatus Cloacimonadota bacterium]
MIMAFMIEPVGEDGAMLTITSVEGFTAEPHPDGTIQITGPRDAFAGLGELLVDEEEGE